jgi:hypothetical protein
MDRQIAVAIIVYCIIDYAKITQIYNFIYRNFSIRFYCIFLLKIKLLPLEYSNVVISYSVNPVIY